MDEAANAVVRRTGRKGVVSPSGRQITIDEDETGRLVIEVAGVMDVVQIEMAQGKTVISLYAPKH